MIGAEGTCRTCVHEISCRVLRCMQDAGKPCPLSPPQWQAKQQVSYQAMVDDRLCSPGRIPREPVDDPPARKLETRDTTCPTCGAPTRHLAGVRQQVEREQIIVYVWGPDDKGRTYRKRLGHRPHVCKETHDDQK